MTQYRFEKTIKVEGVKYTAGTVVDAGEIPSGCLESMLRLRQVVEFDPRDPATVFAAVMSGAPVPAVPAPVAPAIEPPKPPEPKVDPKPEDKPAEPEPPVDAKAKPPVIGPTKPPELKAHGKK